MSVQQVYVHVWHSSSTLVKEVLVSQCKDLGQGHESGERVSASNLVHAPEKSLALRDFLFYLGYQKGERRPSKMDEIYYDENGCSYWIRILAKFSRQRPHFFANPAPELCTL